MNNGINNGMAFPLGSGPLVSILLATRGRSNQIRKAVDTLYSLASRKDKIEFLFRVDTDDSDTIRVCSDLTQKLPNASLLIEPRGRGYLDMHHWMNRLCKLARGDWVAIWNDDSFIKTQDWDVKLADAQVRFWHTCPDVAYIYYPTVDRPMATEFYFLRRKAVEIMGHLSLSPHTDNWICRVMRALGSAATLSSIQVDHLSHLMEDETRTGSVAAYGNGELAKETLDSEEAQRGIQDSIAKLQNHILQYMGKL